MAGGHHVRQRQQGRQQRGVGGHREFDQGAVGVRDADGFALPSVDAAESVPAAAAARDVQALGAVVARVVAVGERGDDQVARLQAGHVRAGLLDDAEELVAHGAAGVGGGHRLVGPQVAAAHAGGDDADHSVGGVRDLRVGPVLDADVACSVHHCCTHERGDSKRGRSGATRSAASRGGISVRASAPGPRCGCRRRRAAGC